VLAVSLAAHGLLLAGWMSTRPDLKLAESPTLEVQLVRLPPKPKRLEAPPKTTPPPRPGLPQPAPVEPPPTQTPPPSPQVAPPVAPRPLTDQELLAGLRLPTLRQLRDAPVRDGSWTTAAKPPRPKCKPAEGYPGPPLPCPGEMLKDPNRPYDVDRDAPDSELARAGRYKRAMKTYKELPGGAGYPGIACAIFHKC
jgi:hypothetical protein